ncbi:hypothetical protein ACOSQ2_033022 [Xanthoceras sorbifolium]
MAAAAASSQAASSQVKLKLLIDTSNKTVLFAEAGKDFLDFLFYLLSLPVATVVSILNKKGKDLSETYIQQHQNKTSLLNPPSPLSANGTPLLLSDQSMTRKVYICSYDSKHLSYPPNYTSPHCRRKMTTEGFFVDSAPASTSTTGGSNVEGGFVKGVVTYMVLDNLEVKPVSTTSSIALLNEFNVKMFGLKLSKESMEYKNALTRVFVRNKY